MYVTRPCCITYSNIHVHQVWNITRFHSAKPTNLPSSDFKDDLHPHFLHIFVRVIHFFFLILILNILIHSVRTKFLLIPYRRRASSKRFNKDTRVEGFPTMNHRGWKIVAARRCTQETREINPCAVYNQLIIRPSSVELMAEPVDKFESRSAATLPDEGEGSSPTHRSRPRCLPSYVEDFSRSDPTSHGWHVPVVMTSSVTEFNLQRPSPLPIFASAQPAILRFPFSTVSYISLSKEAPPRKEPNFAFSPPLRATFVDEHTNRWIWKALSPLTISLSLSVFESRESLFTWKGSKIRPG